MPEFRVPSPEAPDSPWSDVMDIDGPSYGEIVITETPARRAAVESESDQRSQPIRMGWLSIYGRVMAGLRRITSFYSSPAGARVHDIQRVAVPVGGDSRKRRCATAEDLEGEILQEEEEDLWEEAPAVDEDRVYVPGWYPASPVLRRRVRITGERRLSPEQLRAARRVTPLRDEAASSLTPVSRARANAERNAQFRCHTPDFRLALPPRADFDARWMSPISEKSEEASSSAQISSAISTPGSCGQVVESPPSCGQRVVRRRAAPITSTQHVTAGVATTTSSPCPSPQRRQFSPTAMPTGRKSWIANIDRTLSESKDHAVDKLVSRANQIRLYDLATNQRRSTQQEAELERLRAEIAILDKNDTAYRRQIIRDALNLRNQYRQAHATGTDLTFAKFKQLKLEEKSLAEARARQQAEEKAQQEAALEAEREAAHKAQVEAAAHAEFERLIAAETAKELEKRRQEARLQAKVQKDAARQNAEQETAAREHAAALAATRAELVAKQDAARKAADEAAVSLHQQQQQAKQDAEAAELKRQQDQEQAKRDAEAAELQRQQEQEQAERDAEAAELQRQQAEEQAKQDAEAAELQRQQAAAQPRHWSGFDIGAPLPGDWEQKIFDRLRAGTNPEEILASIERPYSPLNRASLQRILADGSGAGVSSWLNDDAINGFLAAICQARNEARPQNQARHAPYYVAFNSGWWSRINSQGVASLRSWTRRQRISGQQLLEAEFIFFPVCKGSHWTLMVIEPIMDDEDEPSTDGFIHYYDSMLGAGHDVMEWGRTWLQDQLGDVFQNARWKVARYRSAQQDNFNDCGIFTCMNALACSLGSDHVSHDVQPHMMPNCRKQVAAVLLNEGFKGDFALKKETMSDFSSDSDDD